MAKLISIVIVNYNVKVLLLDCISSIYAYTKLELEIIVVDNNSTDNSLISIREKFPEVILIENKHNEGFPKANNQGFAISKGKYILMLNPDTVITVNAIDKMVAYMESNNSVSMLGPKLLNTDLSTQYSIQRFVTVAEILLETVFLHTLYKSYHSYLKEAINEPMEVEALSGAAILFPNTLYLEIGGLDEELFWTEDMEFCYRAFKRGKRIIYYPGAEIIHHIGASGKQNMIVMVSRQVLTKITYFKKNHSIFAFQLVKFARLMHMLSRIFIFTLLSLTGNKNFRIKLNAYFFTLKEFINNRY